MKSVRRQGTESLRLRLAGPLLGITIKKGGVRASVKRDGEGRWLWKRRAEGKEP